MKTIIITEDEYFPFYDIRNLSYTSGYKKMSDDKIDWILKTMNEFDKVQKYLSKHNSRFDFHLQDETYDEFTDRIDDITDKRKRGEIVSLTPEELKFLKGGNKDAKEIEYI